MPPRIDTKVACRTTPCTLNEVIITSQLPTIKSQLLLYPWPPHKGHPPRLVNSSYKTSITSGHFHLEALKAHSVPSLTSLELTHQHLWSQSSHPDLRFYTTFLPRAFATLPSHLLLIFFLASVQMPHPQRCMDSGNSLDSTLIAWHDTYKYAYHWFPHL